MNLSAVGEARVNGYLFVLQRSLRTFLPRDSVQDAVREIESHLRERISVADGAPNERDALERILAELGPPMRVAQAYSAERTIDEAVTTGRFVPMVRAVWHLAVSTVVGFFAGLALFVGYAVSIATLLMGLLKPFFPGNIGIQFVNGIPIGPAAEFPVPVNADIRGGWWIVPVFVASGFAGLVLMQRCARRYLGWWRSRR